MHKHRRRIINTHPRRGTNSKQLYSKYARLIDDYEHSIGDEALHDKQTILDIVNNLYSWLLTGVFHRWLQGKGTSSVSACSGPILVCPLLCLFVFHINTYPRLLLACFIKTDEDLSFGCN